MGYYITVFLLLQHNAEKVKMTDLPIYCSSYPNNSNNIYFIDGITDF
jgi:hypothetical protein